MLNNSAKILFLLSCFCGLGGCSKSAPNFSFYDVPWPSDTRTVEDGNTLLSSGQRQINYFPHSSPNSLLVNEKFAAQILYRQGAYKAQQGGGDLAEKDPSHHLLPKFAFGVNSGVFFKMDQTIDISSLPDNTSPLESIADDSSIMLVNIDETSTRYLERIPVLVDLKQEGTQTRVANLLSLIPYPGYSLEQGSIYAAIVFNGLKDSSGSSVVRSKLLDSIKRASSYEQTIFTSKQLSLWKEHQAVVEKYVVENTSWNIENIVNFTVYSTQNVAKTALDLADGLHTLNDDDIRGFIVYDAEKTEKNPTIVQSCDGYHSYAIVAGNLKMPNWQSGDYSSGYVLDGGAIENIRFDENNKIIVNKTLLTPFQVAIPCSIPGTTGRPYVVSEPGTGGSALDGLQIVTETLEQTSRSKDIIAISVPSYIANEARWPMGAKSFWNLVKGFSPADMTESQFLMNLRNNFLNPVSANDSQIQVAAESYILKRIAENLQWIAMHYLDATVLQFAGLSTDHFRVEKGNGGLTGFSQGANNGFISMSMDSDYKFAYFGSGAGYFAPMIAQREDLRAGLLALFPYVTANELDIYHPLTNIMQSLLERMSSVNYIPYVGTGKNILLTAGEYDDKTVPLATQANGIAAARYDLVGFTNFESGYGLVDVDGFNQLLAPLKGMQGESIPVEGNLASGKSGLFSMHPGVHNMWKWFCGGGVGEFFYTASHDAKIAKIDMDVNSSFYYCSSYYPGR